MTLTFYIYQGTELCGICGERLGQKLFLDSDNLDDSETFPQGPYEVWDQEVDRPMHCGACTKFLGGKLTSDGEAYVVYVMGHQLIPEWLEAYGYLLKGRPQNG